MTKLFANDFELDFRITEKTDGAFHRRARKGGGNKKFVDDLKREFESAKLGKKNDDK